MTHSIAVKSYDVLLDRTYIHHMSFMSLSKNITINKIEDRGKKKQKTTLHIAMILIHILSSVFVQKNLENRHPGVS